MNEVILRNNVAVELSVVYKQTNSRSRGSRRFLVHWQVNVSPTLHFKFFPPETDSTGNHNHA